jgi:error-prone DNA polymerase
VIWESVFKQFALIAKTTSFLGVSGKLQAQEGITHVIAEKLWIPDSELRPTPVHSRDFR